ncbi:alternate-type signal peptide domain-containing protein [Rhodococcus qingshengii]|uniref:alternate-type signal peptide domain-containing protein n=1 Tax=Rhodococcus qingshengii TaxID=334542 RepID=UPI0036D96FB4
MNKTTKGAIAAGAAAVLLAGGAGTMAAWNASTNGGAPQTVGAGSLSVEQVGAGVWKWANGSTFNPASDLIVPGDVVTYTANYSIDLVGTNLKAKLTPSLTGVTGDLVTLNQLTVAPASGTVTTYTAGLDQAATFTTTITFNAGAAGDNTGQTKTASLAGGAVTLEQTLN